MKPRTKLYLQRNIYNHQSTDGLFLAAIKSNVQYHRSHCKEYDEILHAMDFGIEDLTDIEMLHRLPFITTMYLKSHNLVSMNDWRLPVKATSSGTSGIRSHIGYNVKLLIYAGVMALKMISYHKLLSRKRTNYIMLGHEPHNDNKTVITRTQGIATHFAPAKSKEYALKFTEKEYKVDYFGVKNALKKYAQEKYPVRFIGFPSYMLFLLQELKKENTAYTLPKGSKVLLGGGWKGFYKEKVEKEVLYEGISKTLGISEEHCHEFFGVAEHPVLYCSCPNHHFHIPNFSRVIIRNTETLEPVENGEIGLVNLLTPVADSMPITSIMTDDLGVLHDGHECGCGITTPYFEIIGRVGMKGVQTCAVKADELLGVK